MCGIAGIVSLNGGREVRREDLGRMISAVRHRGPDESGIYTGAGAGLAHARLSIIDLSTGQQPLSNEDGTIWITFNGEIFNYVELSEGLRKRGHVLKTRSDTEVIVHLYEDYGHECLSRLNGQFAFAIWDSRAAELFMARDRLGIRPLFYAARGDSLYFASEVKAIFAAGAVPRALDPLGLDEVFTFWTTVAPRTAFKDVYELPPGHSLTARRGVVSTRRYWDVEMSDNGGLRSFEDSMEELKALLIDSTRLQLRADVPVGAYLSGGLDSSVTTALIRNFSSSRLKTFSVAFEDPDCDESEYQHEMSSALGTEHHEVRCSYADISGSFQRVIWHAEKPILRTAPVPLFLLSGLVRESGFKVVLTGEGADEVLGGYDIFKETKIRQFWAARPDSQMRPLLLKRLYPYLPAFQGQSGAYREAFFNTGLSDPADVFFSHRPRWQTTARNRIFYSKDLLSALNGTRPEDRLSLTLPAGFGAWPPLARAQYLETKQLLAGYILSSQGDRVLMANSIEGRFPFLDHRVVEFCARLPLHYKIRGLNEKYLLKKTMGRYLPERIYRRTKRPYMAPDVKSFFAGGRAEDYVAELLSDGCIRAYGYFDPGPVRHLVEKCKRGAAIGFKDNMALVGILSTQVLHRGFIEGFDRSVAGEAGTGAKNSTQPERRHA